MITDNNFRFKVFSNILKDGATLFCYTGLEAMLNTAGRKRQSTRFYWLKSDDIVLAGSISIDDVKELSDLFVVEKDGILYCFFSSKEVYKSNYTTETKWYCLTDDDYTAPLVAYNGTQIDGYNLLCGRYRIQEEINQVPCWMLPHKIPEGEVKITARIIGVDSDDEVHTVIVDGSSVDENGTYTEEVAINSWKLCVQTKPAACGSVATTWVGIADQDGNLISGASTFDGYVIEIGAVYDSSAEQKKVFGMTKSIWFGGSANGISDGSRLFLCGNTNENEQALVVWSGLNDPLYWPENNYAYVGNKAQAVKTFGKQDDKLVIFKPNETYYTYYAQNTEITADDLINQSVVDYQANSVYFPMIQLNGAIGCDMPDTVQLCRNRLVWANSNGKVYTLVSTNQYSEMSVYEASQMIERKIREANYTAEQFATAQTCDFAGHYILIIGQDAYVMDYNSYGYQYVYGHLKNEDANIKIPWYVWKLGKGIPICFGENIAYFNILNQEIETNRWLMATVLSSGNSDIVDQYIESAEYDFYIDENGYTNFKTEANIATVPIKSTLTTKLFDFGVPHYRKNVDRVNIAFANNGGAPITVRFVTDVGTEEETVYLSGSELTAYTPAYVTVKHFNPCIRAHTRFGIQIECDGILAVDAVNLLYRLLGGVR